MEEDSGGEVPAGLQKCKHNLSLTLWLLFVAALRAGLAKDLAPLVKCCHLVCIQSAFSIQLPSHHNQPFSLKVHLNALKKEFNCGKCKI